jgi:sugar phosphate permease
MSAERVGWVMTALLLAYGAGQIVHGLLVDRFGARRLGTAGMLLSGACNLAFGLVGSFPAFLGLWAVNGFAQATGAPSRVKTLGNWFPADRRGRMMGLLGTDYVVGNALAWLLAGWLLGAGGWRAAFLVPGAIFLASALHFALRVRDRPADVGLPAPPDAAGPADLRLAVQRSFLSWRVWVVALAYFGVDLFRYGFLNWSFAYLVEGQREVDVTEGVLKVVMVPAFGALGILASGWLTDRMGGRRVPVVCGMLLGAALFAGLLGSIPRDNLLVALVLLAGIGFFLYGPHLLMGATLAIDLGTPGAAGTASGLIDALGYAGAAVSGVGTAWARDAWGWDGAFALWIGAAVGAALLMAVLWKVKPEAAPET